ncbi:hypothetical protein [Streptomyces sp. NPDC056061]|uniref:hypothetical protein n=1 Tax=Streptomyces sp. NPDC056061 TaxID=3345700 RepID=UPI0035DC269E
MDWKLPFSPGVRHLIAGAALVALALTWLADLALLFPEPRNGTASAMPATNWLSVFVTGPLATLSLVGNRRLPSLARRGVLVAAMSMALS